MTLVMVLFVYIVYKKTYSGVLYSKNFNITLVVTSLVVTAIMIGISGNIVLSLGLVGALSIIRFRTAVKDPKDTAFLFWAITIGVINGVAYYELALIASIFIGAVITVFSKGRFTQESFVLVLQHVSGQFTEAQAVLNTHFPGWSVRTDANTGDHIEKVVEVGMTDVDREQALAQLRASTGVQKVILLSSKGEFSE